MKQLYHGLRQHPEALIAGIAGLLVAAVSMLILGTKATETPTGTARFLVNLFKFGIGLYSLGIAFYLFYGPMLHDRAVAPWLMPAEAPPLEYPILFASLGAASILTSLAIVQPGLAHVLFWRVVGFSILGAAITGYFVLIVERLARDAS